MRLLTHEVVTLGSVAHWQNIVGEPGGFAPCWSKAGVPFNFALVGQGLDPAKPIRIRPHRVVDARKIKREFPAPFFQKMRQQKTHFEKRQGKLACPHQLVPCVRWRRHHGRCWDVLVPCTGGSSARSSYCTYQHG